MCAHLGGGGGAALITIISVAPFHWPKCLLTTQTTTTNDLEIDTPGFIRPSVCPSDRALRCVEMSPSSVGQNWLAWWATS